MSAIDLYYMPVSSPCRSVMMLAKELNIELNLKFLNLMAKEHLEPEFLEINPQHSVPTIVDDGFVLWESRAILQYLCNKTNSELYPSDIKERAIVDRMLQFDMGSLSKSINEFLYPQLMAKAAPDAEKEQKMKDSLGFLDQFIGSNGYVAGDKLTIADLSIFSAMNPLSIMLDYDLADWKNVDNWIKKLKNDLPYNEEINEKPLRDFKEKMSK